MNTDPRDTISNMPMSWLQIVVIAITVGLNALDGFDVLRDQLCVSRYRG